MKNWVCSRRSREQQVAFAFISQQLLLGSSGSSSFKRLGFRSPRSGASSPNLKKRNLGKRELTEFVPSSLKSLRGFASRSLHFRSLRMIWSRQSIISRVANPVHHRLRLMSVTSAITTGISLVKRPPCLRNSPGLRIQTRAAPAKTARRAPSW